MDHLNNNNHKMNNNDLHQPDDSRLKEMAGNGPEFRVPQGYFDELPSAISERIARPVSAKGFFTLPRLITVMSVVVVVALAAFYLSSLQKEEQKTAQYLTYDEMIESGFVSEFDEQMLYLEVTSDQSYDQSYYEYKNYLIENNIELSLIMSEI